MPHVVAYYPHPHERNGFACHVCHERQISSASAVARRLNICTPCLLEVTNTLPGSTWNDHPIEPCVRCDCTIIVDVDPLHCPCPEIPIEDPPPWKGFRMATTEEHMTYCPMCSKLQPPGWRCPCG